MEPRFINTPSGSLMQHMARSYLAFVIRIKDNLLMPLIIKPVTPVEYSVAFTRLCLMR